jgi:hypothetical protein
LALTSRICPGKPSAISVSRISLQSEPQSSIIGNFDGHDQWISYYAAMCKVLRDVKVLDTHSFRESSIGSSLGVELVRSATFEYV